MTYIYSILCTYNKSYIRSTSYVGRWNVVFFDASIMMIILYTVGGRISLRTSCRIAQGVKSAPLGSSRFRGDFEPIQVCGGGF